MILDLYAGAGGWDVGADSLGLETLGLELWHDACRTAVAAGFARVRCDVATYPTAPFAGRLSGLVGSPPCRAWSTAGKRLGSLDRARVHALVDAYAQGLDRPWADGWHDEGSHHAAQPVRWVRDLRPAFVCLEQVPPVLDLWRHIAIVLRGWGYRTWTGVLNAADYGVPQTRERAILIARLTGPAAPPEPSHARHPGEDLFGAALEPWVSMAAALGWLPGAVATTNNSLLSRVTRESSPYERDTDRPAPTLTGNTGKWQRCEALPAPTVTAGGTGGGGGVEVFAGADSRRRVEAERERALALRNGNQANACTRELDEPAGTLFFGARMNAVEWVLRAGAQANATERSLDEPAATVLCSRAGNIHWSRRSDLDGTGTRPVETSQITEDEAAVLQSFPVGYPWTGTKGGRYQQIGNAVPPTLAARVIAAATGRCSP